MSYKPTLIIPSRDPVIALVFTDKFWKKATKLGLENRVLELVNDLILKIHECGLRNSINEPRISRVDRVYRVRLGKYRLFYKLDHKRNWMIFYDIEKRNEHTYKHERSFRTHVLRWCR